MGTKVMRYLQYWHWWRTQMIASFVNYELKS